MQVKFLGDSFDIVKQSLLRWLAPCGAWSAHPMFTAEPTVEQADVYARLLGVPLISREVLSKDRDRATYFAPARACATHLFLDPDTGSCFKRSSRKRDPRYLYSGELVDIATRSGLLTLVFDQSLRRGHELAWLHEKLSMLAAERLSAVAYVSHACFILLGQERELVEHAVAILQKQSHLPHSRFLVAEEKTTKEAVTRVSVVAGECGALLEDGRPCPR